MARLGKSRRPAGAGGLQAPAGGSRRFQIFSERFHLEAVSDLEAVSVVRAVDGETACPSREWTTAEGGRRAIFRHKRANQSCEQTRFLRRQKTEIFAGNKIIFAQNLRHALATHACQSHHCRCFRSWNTR